MFVLRSWVLAAHCRANREQGKEEQVSDAGPFDRLEHRL
jgi:hypothetical protein